MLLHEQGQAIIAKDTVIASKQSESGNSEVSDKKGEPAEKRADVSVDGIPVYYTMTIMACVLPHSEHFRRCILSL